MKPKLIPAALVAAMLTTQGHACEDWPAVLALDSTISAEIAAEIETEKAAGREPPVSLLKEDAYNRLGVINDKADAAAGNCYRSER